MEKGKGSSFHEHTYPPQTHSEWCSECRRLLRQSSPDDAVDLFVDVQFGQTAALGVVGHADGHWPGALGDWHRDLKQLQREAERWIKTRCDE